jgi:hypothetical protein
MAVRAVWKGLEHPSDSPQVAFHLRLLRGAFLRRLKGLMIFNIIF